MCTGKRKYKVRITQTLTYYPTIFIWSVFVRFVHQTYTRSSFRVQFRRHKQIWSFYLNYDFELYYRKSFYPKNYSNINFLRNLKYDFFNKTLLRIHRAARKYVLTPSDDKCFIYKKHTPKIHNDYVLQSFFSTHNVWIFTDGLRLFTVLENLENHMFFVNLYRLAWSKSLE